jgi:hypothetical protein
MKRTFAAVVLLIALSVLIKLAWKDAPGPANPGDHKVAHADRGTQPDPETQIRQKYPADRALVDRTLHEFHHNAVSIEQTDGLRGLVLLDRLGLEAVYLYEKFPNEFRRLRDAIDDKAAADLLLHWREYFGLKRADDTDRALLIAEIAALTPRQKHAAAQYPNALPLILAEPVGVTELIERAKNDPDDLRDSLVVLDFISLERGAADLRAALRTLDEHGPLALDAFRQQGPEGFALVKLYGPVLELLADAMPLDQALIVLRVNSDYLDGLLATHSAETVAGYLRHVAAAGLVEQVGGGPNTLRLSVEYGARGDQALARAGADAADVVFDDYADPALRDQAVSALAEHGPMALAVLSKYAVDADFREVLRKYGPRVITPVAQVDSSPEALAALRAKGDKSFTETLAQGVLALSRDSGQATIHMIKSDGLERVEALNSTEVEFYQFLPLYDLLHLGSVMTRGQSPTTGEMTWAVIDGCFAIADVLSLATVQPEGVVAVEAVRSEAKSATRQAAKSAGRELVESATEAAGRTLAQQGAEAATGRLSRWWAVRLAGGTYRVLQRLPEALGRMSVGDIARIGRPLCEKAGLRLSTWGPLRFLKDGVTVVRSIPPSRGLKYVGAQAVQATVGVVGFQKMEEHLASRRPKAL